MKRYLIFAAIGPFVGGLLLLFATTVASRLLDRDLGWTEVGKFFHDLLPWTLQYGYLFGIAYRRLMIGAIDDILFHLPRIRPCAADADSGRDRIYRVGIDLRLARSGSGRAAVRCSMGWSACVPALLSSWLAHKYAGAGSAGAFDAWSEAPA